jgi:hypothetical protein
MMEIEGIELLPDFKGAPVVYVPMHAGGDVTHRDCESGTISSWNDKFVFVSYRGNSRATDPRDLRWLGKPNEAEWFSNCCGAAPKEWFEQRICSDCKEHCSYERHDYDGNVIEEVS